MQKEIQLGDRTVRYELEIKKVKNINLRVTPKGVFVSAPSEDSLWLVEEFLRSKTASILTALDQLEAAEQEQPEPMAFVDGDQIPFLGEPKTLRVQLGQAKSTRIQGDELLLFLPRPGDPAQRREVLETFLERQLDVLIAAYFFKYMPRFERFVAKEPSVRIRPMRTRWGSCNPVKCSMTFNTALIAAPMDCVEYVVVHELTHFIYQNHSRAFRSALSFYLPGWRAREKRLKEVPIDWLT